MAILNFQKPDKVIMIESTDFSGRFEFRPLEPGFGLTVGNALRRVLLSSLEGFAVSAIRIAGVDHEFSSIRGVVQDVVEISPEAAATADGGELKAETLWYYLNADHETFLFDSARGAIKHPDPSALARSVTRHLWAKPFSPGQEISQLSFIATSFCYFSLVQQATRNA